MNAAKRENAKLAGFAELSKKKNDEIMSVFCGEKTGIAAVAVVDCGRDGAERIAEALAALLNSFENSSFSCSSDENGRARFALLGNAEFVSEAMKLISESGAFGVGK